MQNARLSLTWMVASVRLGALGILLLQNMQTRLNEFGAGGWELVAVSMGNMTEPRLIFKK